MTGGIAKAALGLLRGAGSVLGLRRGTEEPAYRVEGFLGDVEMRRYGRRVAAETIVTAGEEAARNVGFRRLAGYIFGGNTARNTIAMTAPVAQYRGGERGEKIAMTAPVSQQPGAEGGWVIRFFMPAEKTLESLPAPNDAAVRLVSVAAETVAVRRFSGSRSRRAIARRTAQLMLMLRAAGVEPIGPPVAWFYDPPWTIPALRRNEIAVPVKTGP